MVNEFQPSIPENIQEETNVKDMYLYKCPACGASQWISDDTVKIQCSCGYICAVCPSGLFQESVYEKNKETAAYNVFECPERAEFDLDYLPKN